MGKNSVHQTYCTNKPGILVIGIGNIYRSDDALGLTIAQYLRKQAPKHTIILEGNGDGTVLTEYWKNTHAVILIDAVRSGAKPGTLYRFDVQAQPIPKFANFSTHSFGIAEAIELARALNQLPRHCIVYGIEGKHFGVGIGLSSEVREAIQEVVTQIKQDIHFLVQQARNS